MIVADLNPDDTQLQAMVDRFREVLPRKTRIVNIREYPFRGGCLGCFNCAITGKCADCASPQRMCNATVVFERAPSGHPFEILLVNEDLGY